MGGVGGVGGGVGGGRWVGAGWRPTGPHRQAHPRKNPQATQTVPNRTVAPMVTAYTPGAFPLFVVVITAQN